MKVFRDPKVRELLHSYLKDMEGSEGCSEVSESFDSMLIQGDRMLVACEGHPKIGRALKMKDALLGLAEKGNDPFELISVALEPWLKSLLYLVCREKFLPSGDKNRRMFNLYGVIERLQLLSKDELECPPGKADASINDYARRHVVLAKELRNPSSHDSELPPQTIIDRARSIGCITVIFTLHKFRSQLIEALSGLITSPFPEDSEVRNLLAMKTDIWKAHVRVFGGRDDWLSKLEEWINPGAYLWF